MPENLMGEDHSTVTPLKTAALIGSTFLQRREDIFRRLQQSAEQCKLNYSDRKELATEKDDMVFELCEALEDAFTYGLRQQNTTVTATAASLFQNMQEIVTGNAIGHSSSNETTFWDFCQIHLTPHERERYESLKHVWTKYGRGKAFIRATLNESSLQRYLLTWLSGEDDLRRYYSPWSLLLEIEAAKQMPQILGNLNKILFALTVDTTDLNVPTRRSAAVPPKEEPLIYAPAPLPIVEAKHKRKANAIERPIATANSTEDLLSEIIAASTAQPKNLGAEMVEATVEPQGNAIDYTPTDPIEPELEFLKQPLPDLYTEINNIQRITNGDSCNAIATTAGAEFEEDKSDTSSQYSKSSSANCGSANQAVFEEKLREMSERCTLLETRVAQLSLENRQLLRRLTQHFNESGIDPSSSLATNFLITIPHVQLIKAKSSSYYAYEIHITMRQNLEHWFLLRRYRDFYKLHTSLLRTHPSISSVNFPPKKHFGNMNLVFVEERRQQLQIYLLNLVESLPQVEACKSKAELQQIFSFLRER